MNLAPLLAFASSPVVEGIASFAIVAIWLGGELLVLVRLRLGPDVGWLPSALLRMARQKGPGREDRGSGLLLLLGFYGWALASWGSFFVGITGLPWYAFYVGLALCATGIAVRLWSLETLGRNFSVLVRTSADQEMIRRGPYRLVRHPSYTAILLIVLGVPLVLLSALGFVVGLVLLSVGIAYRIRVEEAALVRRFGDSYERYRAISWYLFPYVI